MSPGIKIKGQTVKRMPSALLCVCMCVWIQIKPQFIQITHGKYISHWNETDLFHRHGKIPLNLLHSMLVHLALDSIEFTSNRNKWKRININVELNNQLQQKLVDLAWCLVSLVDPNIKSFFFSLFIYRFTWCNLMVRNIRIYDFLHAHTTNI